ncbi:protein LATERAL ORGAN BOUNDARIES-like [Rosa rugosa]|uniref:protein LATERAL ORGAN BOUNDARIES-like n=1 Tax=Rosa rugosa TaxID=74645 RepID=UPI002B411106|nr:protein LATERAL ORGAN BOUNDARIES-like [Rosa rugosa]XP_062029310.1 protein LATERAL ORGAN BOUNDARIES-like [Rosa rugosa]
MASSSSSSYNSPCAACKFLRRKCMPGCIFAPYFPPEEPQKFANVHKIFGASNVTKLLNDLLPHQREDAVNSLAYEAEARVRDPVYGCVGAISFLQRQVQRLQKELDTANADLIRYACNEIIATPGVNPVVQQQIAPRSRSIDHHQFYQQGSAAIPPPAANFQVPYNLPWNVDLQNRTSGDHINEGGGCGEGTM